MANLGVRVQDILAQVQQVRSMPEVDRNKMLTQALEGINRGSAGGQLIQVENLQPLTTSLLELDGAALEHAAEAATSLAESIKPVEHASSSGGSGKADALAQMIGQPDPKAVEVLHAAFTSLPVTARKAAIQLLPEQARPAVIAVQFLSSEQAGALSAQIPEIMSAAAVAQQPIPAAADCDNGTQEVEALKKARVDAVMSMRRVFTSLPQRARKELTKVVPAEQQGMVQMLDQCAEGIQEEDVVVMLDTMDGQLQGRKPSSGSGSGKGEDGEGESGKELKTQQMKELAHVAAAGARLETRRLWK